MSDTLVIDLETKKSFAEVGGERNKKDLGISVAGVYSYAKDSFIAFEEHEMARFEELLLTAGHLVGFNIKQFDLPVLEPYLSRVLTADFAVTDIFEDALNFLGHRVGLSGVAEATVGASKSGHGLEALQWYKEGRIEEVKNYCLDDVRLTRDVYDYGRRHGHILFRSYTDGKNHSIPVHWGDRPPHPPIRRILEEALAGRRRLLMEYVSSEDPDGLGFRKKRLIDIYRIKENDEIEAYCHLRRGLRNFRIKRIISAEPTADTYIIPQDFQASLFV